MADYIIDRVPSIGVSTRGNTIGSTTGGIGKPVGNSDVGSQPTTTTTTPSQALTFEQELQIILAEELSSLPVPGGQDSADLGNGSLFSDSSGSNQGFGGWGGLAYTQLNPLAGLASGFLTPSASGMPEANVASNTGGAGLLGSDSGAAAGTAVAGGTAVSSAAPQGTTAGSAVPGATALPSTASGGTALSSFDAGTQMAIMQSAEKYGVNPNVIAAIIHQESGGNPGAVSSAGALGLMQLMPTTAQSLGVTNPFDAAQNIDGGTRYFSQLMGEFGRVDLALAAYNAGPGAVRSFGGVPPYSETQQYVQNVLRRAGSSEA